MYIIPSIRPKQRALHLATLIFANIFSHAQADTYRTFEVSGTFTDGTQVTGTIDWDIDFLYFTHPSLQVHIKGAASKLAYMNGGGSCGENCSLWAVGSKANNVPFDTQFIFYLPLYPDKKYRQGFMDTPSMPGPGGSNSALTYEDANGNYNTVFLTSGYLYAEPKTCGAVVSGSGVTPSSSGPTITATFIPSGGLTLKDAAAVCGVQDFDWQQIATRVPKPSPFFANSDPSKPLVAPPDFFDPPLGGYTYAPGFDPFPFYYRAQNDYTGMYGVNNLINHEPTPTELDFQDQPQDSKLLPGKVLCYSTSLVGVLPSYTATAPLATFYWTSNYNGVSGVVTFQKCPAP